MSPIRAAFALPALAAALVAAAPPAEDWQYLATGGNGAIFSLDHETVTLVDGYRQAWTRSDYSNVATGDVSLRRSLEDFDCNARASRLRGTVAYGRDGKVLRTSSFAPGETDWTTHAAETIGATKVNAVCAAALN